MKKHLTDETKGWKILIIDVAIAGDLAMMDWVLQSFFKISSLSNPTDFIKYDSVKELPESSSVGSDNYCWKNNSAFHESHCMLFFISSYSCTLSPQQKDHCVSFWFDSRKGERIGSHVLWPGNTQHFYGTSQVCQNKIHNHICHRSCRWRHETLTLSSQCNW